MAGLVPAIHDISCGTKNVDALDKPGHDGVFGTIAKPPAPLNALLTITGASLDLSRFEG
ncbi:hypothetical protein ACIPUD_09050 [Bradyrhizobium sp. CAR08]